MSDPKGEEWWWKWKANHKAHLQSEYPKTGSGFFSLSGKRKKMKKLIHVEKDYSHFMVRRQWMFKRLLFMGFGILSIGLAGCNIKTPEIRGLVLDAETNQPVEGAWIQATLQIKTKTIQGNVQTVLRVEPPHTRSDKNGAFVIPSKEFQKPSFPAGFGTDVESFTINASTLDDKSDGFYLKEYERKKKIEVILHVKPWKEGIADEKEYSSYIQSLFNYCLVGRFGVEVPPVEGGCDEWELDFTITKHERFLKRLEEPKTMDQRIHYSGTMHDLGYLYKRKTDYKRALEIFIKAREFDSKRKMDLWLKEYDFQINELQQLIHRKK